jgi:hypothetical protein
MLVQKLFIMIIFLVTLFSISSFANEHSPYINTQKIDDNLSVDDIRYHDKAFFVNLEYVSQASATNFKREVQGAPDGTGSTPISSYGTSVGVSGGYQFYQTRVYATYVASIYKDGTKYHEFTKWYALNADYFPVVYELNQVRFRPFAGFSAGFTNSEIRSDTPAGFKETQRNMMFGYNVGGMLEFKTGVRLEVGYRYREGMLLSSDTFSARAKSSQSYIGLGYTF